MEKINRTALRSAICNVTALLGLDKGKGRQMTEEQREAREAKRNARKARNVALYSAMATGLGEGKNAKGKPINIKRQITVALTLVKVLYPLPEAFVTKADWSKAADALVEAGKARNIREQAVRDAFRLPGGVAVQVAPSGAVIEKVIPAGPGIGAMVKPALKLVEQETVALVKVPVKVAKAAKKPTKVPTKALLMG